MHETILSLTIDKIIPHFTQNILSYESYFCYYSHHYKSNSTIIYLYWLHSNKFNMISMKTDEMFEQKVKELNIDIVNLSKNCLLTQEMIRLTYA